MEKIFGMLFVIAIVIWPWWWLFTTYPMELFTILAVIGVAGFAWKSNHRKRRQSAVEAFEAMIKAEVTARPQPSFLSVSEMRDQYYSIVHRTDLTSVQKELEVSKLKNLFGVLIEGTVSDVRDGHVYVDVPEINMIVCCHFSSYDPDYNDEIKSRKRWDRMNVLNVGQHVSLTGKLGGSYICDPFACPLSSKNYPFKCCEFWSAEDEMRLRKR